MTVAAAHASAFYREVAERRSLWTIRDAGGFPQPKGADGTRAQPFWSSRSRAERVITTVEAYAAFEVVELPWSVFKERWVPGLTGDGVLVGVNWSGPRATGYDVAPADVVTNVEVRFPSNRWSNCQDKPGQVFLNAFETAILERLGHETPALLPLIGQLHVLSREFTGVGSFTKFSPVPALNDPELGEKQLGLDSLIVVPGVPNGIGAVLFCSNGYPDMLETFTYGDLWDGTFDGFYIEDSKG